MARGGTHRAKQSFTIGERTCAGARPAVPRRKALCDADFFPDTAPRRDIMSLELKGIHHLTAVTARAKDNVAFYTGTMGMRLIKKTVNQDDTSAYHLFYGDAVASPGADLTFFDWPVAREQRGNHSISRTGLRVGSDEDLAWWKTYLANKDIASGEIAERAGHLSLDFEDFEGQRFRLVSDPRSA